MNTNWVGVDTHKETLACLMAEFSDMTTRFGIHFTRRTVGDADAESGLYLMTI